MARAQRQGRESELIMANDVRDNAALHRFELEVDGHLAVSYYHPSPGLITFTHTEVPPALGGRGVGSTLIRGALELARAQGLKVVSKCPFVSAYLGKHPEFNDLVG
jgi:predicted GNAT family acetyltransferase